MDKSCRCVLSLYYSRFLLMTDGSLSFSMFCFSVKRLMVSNYGLWLFVSALIHFIRLVFNPLGFLIDLKELQLTNRVIILGLKKRFIYVMIFWPKHFLD